MATPSENLLQLNQTKQALKTAIEGKGQDLTGVPFTEYASKIDAIQGVGLTKEVEVTSSVVNVLELAIALFGNDFHENLFYARLKKPKNTTLINNQVIALSSYVKVGRGIRFRDNLFTDVQINISYDAAITIGDIYEVYDFGVVSEIYDF